MTKPKNDHLPWTPALNEQLSTLAKTHKAAEIGVIMGRTTISIWAQCHELGIPLTASGNSAPDWSAEHKAQLWTMREQGASYKELSAALGRSMGSIGRQLSDMRKKRVREPRDPFIKMMQGKEAA